MQHEPSADATSKDVQKASADSTVLELLKKPQTPSGRRSVKRPASPESDIFGADSDDELLDDTKGDGDDKSAKYSNHSEIEKRRRDKMNRAIIEIHGLMPGGTLMAKKLDKLSVLKRAVQYIRAAKGNASTILCGSCKPSFVSNEELRLMLERVASDSFAFVAACDNGEILYVSAQFLTIFGWRKNELLGQTIFGFMDAADVSVYKSLTALPAWGKRDPAEASDASQAECALSDASFGAQCKFKVRLKSNVPPMRQYVLVDCTGYMKTVSTSLLKPLAHERHFDSDTATRYCVVVVGKVMKSFDSVLSVSEQKPLRFTFKYDLAGNITQAGKSMLEVFGYAPSELSADWLIRVTYKDDFPIIWAAREEAQRSATVVTSKLFRLYAKSGKLLLLQSQWKPFRNPWTQQVDFFLVTMELL